MWVGLEEASVARQRTNTHAIDVFAGANDGLVSDK